MDLSFDLVHNNTHHVRHFTVIWHLDNRHGLAGFFFQFMSLFFNTTLASIIKDNITGSAFFI